MSEIAEGLIHWLKRAINHADVPLESFLRQPVRQDALAFCLIALGELAKTAPMPFKEAHPEVPWSQMAKTRDFLAHHPMELSPSLLWEVAHQELPRILAALTRQSSP